MAADTNGALEPAHLVTHQPVEIDWLVGDGPFSHCCGKLLNAPPQTRIVVSCSELCDWAIFDECGRAPV